MIKKQIPNIFTLANLTCGMLASIVIIQSSNYLLAAYLVILGAVFDFFDGFLARLLGVSGELGKQLDSLADMITFGLVPGLIGVFLCQDISFSLSEGISPHLVIYIPIVITLMSAMRLAIFNISTDQSDSFIGVPTPAITIFWIGLPFLLEYLDVKNHYVVITLSLISAVLLVAKFRLIALKFKSFGWNGNEARWVLIGSSTAVLIFLTTITGNLLVALPIIIILYIIISVINNRISKNEL